MFVKEAHYLKDSLGKTYLFTRQTRLDENGNPRWTDVIPCRAYARQTLHSILESGSDPFHYRLLDLWHDTYERPWAPPRSLNQLVEDLATKIASGELKVYVADNPLWHMELPYVPRSGGVAAEADDAGHDMPRSQSKGAQTANDEDATSRLSRSQVPVASIKEQKAPRERLSDLSEAELEHIKNVDTFEPKGVSREEAEDFLENTDEGRKLLEHTAAFAQPGTSPKVVLDRAIGFVQSGVESPTLESVDFALVKIVPAGKGLSAYSPFFTTKDELEIAQTSDRPLSDVFGLPVVNDSAQYDVYEMTPVGTAEVFRSTIAPTAELNGKFTTEGGADQLVVANRNQFESPKKIYSIADN